MSEKKNQVLVAKLIEDGISVPITEPGSSMTLSDQACIARRARITLSAATLTVLEANDYGSLKLCDLPDRNMLLLGVETDLVLTKQGNTNGIVAATDLDVSVGTAAASATTLADGMLNIIEKKDLDTNALAVDLEAHSNDNATTVFPLPVADGASSAVYLNAVAIGGITADSSISVSGTVDIWYMDLGNLSS